MKLATYRLRDQDKVGIVHGDGNAQIFDLAAAAARGGRTEPAFSSMLAMIDEADEALDRARDVFDKFGADPALSSALASVQLLAPLPDPLRWHETPDFEPQD